MDRYSIMLGKVPPKRPKKKVEKAPKPIRDNGSSGDIGFGDRVEEIYPLTDRFMPTRDIPTDTRESVIAQYIRTSDGRARLAASMINPLRDRLNNRSLARRILLVDNLSEGVLPRYDFNRAGTFVIDEAGRNVRRLPDRPQYADRSQRVIIPLFEINSNPQVPLSQIRERQFSLIDRAQELAVSEISSAEDSRALQLLDAVANECDRNISAPSQTLENSRSAEDLFRESFRSIQDNRLNVATVFISAVNYAPIRRHSFLTQRSSQYDLSAGIFGARIIVSRRINAGQIYLTADPQNVGMMPIRSDLTVLSADDPVNHTIGWSIFELIGMFCNNPNGIAKITLS